MRRAGAPSPRAALLTEVVIALALLIPVIVMVAGLFPYSFSVDRRAWNDRTAQSLARSALEEARGTKFENLVSVPPRTVRPEIVPGGQEGTAFTIELVVTDVLPPGAPAGGAPDVREKNVACTVTWPRKNGIDQLKLDTVVARLYQGTPDS